MRQRGRWAIAALAAAALVTAAMPVPGDAADQPKMAGTLRVALTTSPITLDLALHGDLFGIQAHRAHVRGYTAWYSLRFWNVWLQK